MKITTIVRATAAAAVATLCLSPGLAPGAWAQTQPAAATDTVLEADFALALTARGAWSPTVNYVKDDLVTSRGSAWRAKRANINKVPGSTAPSTALDWERFAAGFNPAGSWSNADTYHLDDLVSHLGSTWRARRTSLGKTPGLAPKDWQQFAAKGATGPAGPSSVGTGTAGAPSFSFTGDSNTGIFSPSSGKIALVEDGVLFLHNIGSFNTAMGMSALDSNTTGNSNTAIGDSALTANTTGSSNTAMGSRALVNNTTGTQNTAVGFFALSTNNGSSNTAVGLVALQSNTTGNNNTAMGASALQSNTTGASNTAIGLNALLSNTAGGSNTAIGHAALASNTTGNNNIGVGLQAGGNPTAPSNSIFIGNQGLAADTSTIKIGTHGTQTTAFIAGISGATVANNAAVLINTATGQLGTVVSSRRYKEGIAPMGDMTALLQKLRPVTFRYKQPYVDGPKPLEYGLIAEEVAEVLPDVAVFNKDGAPETVKYHLLPSLLLNEVQAQQKTIASQAEQARQQQTINQAQAEQIAAMEQRLISLEARLSGQGALKAAHAAPRLD